MTIKEAVLATFAKPARTLSPRHGHNLVRPLPIAGGEVLVCLVCQINARNKKECCAVVSVTSLKGTPAATKPLRK